MVTSLYRRWHLAPHAAPNTQGDSDYLQHMVDEDFQLPILRKTLFAILLKSEPGQMDQRNDPVARLAGGIELGRGNASLREREMAVCLAMGSARLPGFPDRHLRLSDCRLDCTHLVAASSLCASTEYRET
jgi:hypothetical protein